MDDTRAGGGQPPTGHWTARTALWVGVALLCAGCGGAGPGVNRTGHVAQTKVLESIGGEDGWVRNDGEVEPNGRGPAVGDLDSPTAGLAVRLFVGFDLGELPFGAVVVGARLRIYTLGVVGQPYTDLGPLQVDHVDYGAALDVTDYAGNTLQSGVGFLATEHVALYRNLDVATQVQADLDAGRPRSQFRLRFPVDANRDGGQDVVLVEDGERSRGTNNRPLLEVQYLVP